jgi:hypothetical protein
MPSDDRERSFQNALARHLHPQAPGDAACSDAETLAAYHEESLDPEQMASMQAHLNDCLRCQQILAHLQATGDVPMPATNVPAPPTAAPKSGVHVLSARRPRFGSWVASAGALAAGLLIWVAIHESNSGRVGKLQLPGQPKPTEMAKAQPSSAPPLSAATTSRNEPLRSDATSRLDTMQPSASRIAPTPQRSQSFAPEKDFSSAPKKSAAGVSGALAVPLPKPANSAASQPSLQPEVPAVTQTVTVEPEPPNNELATTQAAAAGAATNELKAKSENDKRDAAYRGASSTPAITGGAAPLAPSPAAPPPQSSQTVEVTAESNEITNLPVHNRNVANLSNLTPAAQLLLASTTAGVTVSAPGGRVSWRIGQAGVILFSSDVGKTWLVQPSGIITDLLSGSAPSGKVCWLVGRSGTILRTTDKGKHWRKVQPPTHDDFVSVFAVSARQATVSPASGTYQTTDGGVTWNKLPPE